MKRNKKLIASLLVLVGMGLGACTPKTSSSLSSSLPQESTSTAKDSSTTTSEKGEDSTTTSDTTSAEDSTTTSDTTSAEDSTTTTTADSTLTEDSTNDSTSTPENIHSIQVSAPETVRVDAPAEAEAGATVHFTLTYDEDAVVIDSVKVGSVECGINGNGEYYFVMPDEDCTIEVFASEKKDVTYQTITNEASYAIDLIGVGSQAEVGSTVRFSVVVRPGFVFEGLSILSRGFEDTPINFTTSEEGGKTYYEFVMPDAKVIIRAQTSRSNFDIHYDSDLITTVYQTKANSDSEESCRNGYAEFGAKIRVTMRSTDYETVTGLKIEETGEVIEAKASTYYLEATFTMPARSITLIPVTAPLYRPISLVNSDHLTLSAFTKDGEGNYVSATQFVADTEVFLKVDGVTETCAVHTLVAAYSVETSWGSSSTTDDILKNGVNEDGYYSFTMPVADDVTITVTESDMTKFVGYPFIGSYIGDNLYNNATKTDQPVGTKNYSFDITPDGSMTGGKNETITDATNKVGPGTANLDGKRIFAYSDKIIFSQYAFKSLNSNDNIFAVKKQNAEDDNSLYTMDYEIFGDNSFISVQYYREGEPYAAAFVDYNGKFVSEPNYHLDVSFEFIEGEKVTDENAHYRVKDADGTVVCEVGLSGGTGQSHRTIFDGLQGTYTGEKGDLVLDGAGKATLGEESYTYTVLEDGKVKLVQGGTTITIELGEGTYTVTEEVLSENDYMGYTFSGDFERDGDTYTMNVTFLDALNAEFSIKFGSVQMVPNSNWPSDPVQTYEIGEDGVVTLHTFDSDGHAIDLTLTPTEDKSTLTVDKDVSWIYPTAGTVLTRQ